MAEQTSSPTAEAAKAPEFKVFVGNLSYKTTDEELASLFAETCQITEARVARSARRPKGYGFVTCATADDVDKAVAALHHKEVDGRQLNVEAAREREPLPEGEEAPRRPRRSRRNNDRRRREGETEDDEEAAPASADGADATEGSARSTRGRGARGGRGTRGGRGRGRGRNSGGPRGELSETTLFMSNLPYTATEEQVREHFPSFEIVRVHIVRNQAGTPQGVGFVEFANNAAQQQALTELDRKTMEDRIITLRVAVQEKKKDEQSEENPSAAAAADEAEQ